MSYVWGWQDWVWEDLRFIKMDDRLQMMIDALVIFYETNGYENFYDEEIKCRTPEQIYELYEETFAG